MTTIPFPTNWFALTGVPVQPPDVYIPVSTLPNPVFAPTIPASEWVRVTDYHLNELSFSSLVNAETFLMQRGFQRSTDPAVWVSDPPQFIETLQYSKVRIITMRVFT